MRKIALLVLLTVIVIGAFAGVTAWRAWQSMDVPYRGYDGTEHENGQQDEQGDFTHGRPDNPAG